AKLETQNPDTRSKVNGASTQSTTSKIVTNSSRAARILFTQPIVLAMSLYGALVFSSMYTLYATFQDVWSQHPYYFNSTQTALNSLAPAIGFLLAAAFIIPFIDKQTLHLPRSVQQRRQRRTRIPTPAGKHRRRLPAPLAVLVRLDARVQTTVASAANYYIDSFEQYAASALAAEAFLRATLGGIVPLFAPTMFEKLGYGWGMSVFGFLSLVLTPAPMVF
ncbi:MAG: hypothetical protein M1823_007240, partial [Watsoniomyces obsoletus]